MFDFKDRNEEEINIESEKRHFILLKSPLKQTQIHFYYFEGFGVVLYTFAALFGW